MDNVCFLLLVTWSLLLSFGATEATKKDINYEKLIQGLKSYLKKEGGSVAAYPWVGCKGEPWQASEPEGTILSPDFGQNYPDNVECTWIIQLQPWQKITLHFLHFAVEPSDPCEYDYLKLYQKLPNGSWQMLANLCGSLKNSRSIDLDTNIIKLYFRSDGSVTDRGFEITWNSTGKTYPGCGDEPQEFTTAPGVVTSPGYEHGQYPANMKCSYRIKNTKGGKISLSFVDFLIEGGKSCPYDYVLIFDGPGLYSPLLMYACGKVKPDDVITTGDTAFIIFKSDKEDERKGFKIAYEFMKGEEENDDPCDGTPATIEADTASIYSPNYVGKLYPNDADCMWQIQTTTGKSIRLRFKDIGIENHPTCYYDYLKVYSGHISDPSTAKHQAKICGETRPDDIYIEGRKATLYFHTDSSASGPGFYIVMTAEGDDNNIIEPETSNEINEVLDNQILDPCDFETDECGWTTDGAVEWIRRSGSHPSTNQMVMPYKDVNPGNSQGSYMMAKTTDAGKGSIGRLLSPELTSTSALGYCLRFSYFMAGYGMGDLHVKMLYQDGSSRLIWSRSQDHGVKWYKAMATIKSNQNYQIVFEVVVEEGSSSYASIDNVTMTEGACVSAIQTCGSGGNIEESRIMHGELSSTGQWPWIVHLRTYLTGHSGAFMQCGGSLIHPQWVLSAAHCFEYSGAILSNTVVYFGETSLIDLEESNFHLKAEQILIHSGRTSPGVAPNDVALVKLPYPVHMTESINTICLPDSDIFNVGDLCTAIGWGSDQTNQTTKNLFHIEEKIMRHQDCREIFGQLVKEDMMCTEPTQPEKQQSVCKGDSGGPLACKKDNQFMLAGVVSWIAGCPHQLALKLSAPSVFANVVYFYDWIQETIADNTDIVNS